MFLFLLIYLEIQVKFICINLPFFLYNEITMKFLHLKFLILLLLFFVKERGLATEIEHHPSPLLFAESSSRNALDPFIDYSEFQDRLTETKSINFFQSGRSLAINVFGGYDICRAPAGALQISCFPSRPL